jgi:hypothetical protein
MKLEFPKNDATFAKSISAVVRVGDDLWVGGDEGTRAVCLRRAEGASNEPRFASVEGAGLVFRFPWQVQFPGMNGSERFVWQESGELELWLQEQLEDVERKSDHPEALTIWEKDTLVVVCDAPSDARFEEPATITADVFKSPS